MKKISPDNPALYAQRIRASYQKFLEYHSKYPKYVPSNKANVKRLVTEAKKIINLNDTEIINTFYGDETENAILRLMRLINKCLEIMIEAEKLSSGKR